MVSAVSHSHKNNVYHLDLKLENFLIGLDGYIKLADFGLAQKVASGEHAFFGSDQGTKEFKAPEIERCSKENTLYDGEKVDVFALGVLLFCLIFQTRPFELADKNDKRYSRIISGRTDKFWSNYIN